MSIQSSGKGRAAVLPWPHSQGTGAKEGRTITIGPYEARLAAARIRQAHPASKADYRVTGPKVGRQDQPPHAPPPRRRRARVPGLVKTAADFTLLAAAVNLVRLGVLKAVCRNGAWAARLAWGPAMAGQRAPPGVKRSTSQLGSPHTGQFSKGQQRPAAVPA